jgi:hypothetical protein
MVSRKEKKKAVQFICNLLEESGLYNIQQADHKEILAIEDYVLFEEPKEINILIPNFLGTTRDYLQKIRTNQQQGIFPCSIFYKDGKTAFVRLVDNEANRSEKSLKHYNPHELITLREKEKEFFRRFGSELQFYQPESLGLPESIRTYGMKDIKLDYSHIKPGDQGYDFVENRISEVYKLPQLESTLTEAAKFNFLKRGTSLFSKIKQTQVGEELILKGNLIEQELREMAKNSYPDLDPQEAYLLFSPRD